MNGRTLNCSGGRRMVDFAEDWKDHLVEWTWWIFLGYLNHCTGVAMGQGKVKHVFLKSYIHKVCTNNSLVKSLSALDCGGLGLCFNTKSKILGVLCM